MAKPKPIVKRILRYKNRTTLLSVGEIFPKNWEYVIVNIKEKEDKRMLIEFLRVNGEIEKVLKNAKISK